jgi:protein-disulfide isomerase
MSALNCSTPFGAGPGTKPSRRYIAAASIGIGVVVMLLRGVIASPPARIDPPRLVTTLHDLAVLGNPSAKVAVVAFSDFACEACVIFGRETWPLLKARWVDTGEIRFGFRNLPITRHPRALRAAEAAACAHQQDRFWSLYDLLYQAETLLADEKVRHYAEAAGLDLNLFGLCMTTDPVRLLRADAREAAALKVRSAPTFIVGRAEKGERLTVVGVLYGAVPLRQFERAIRASGLRGSS